jgi:hypothetical protein
MLRVSDSTAQTLPHRGPRFSREALVRPMLLLREKIHDASIHWGRRDAMNSRKKSAKILESQVADREEGTTTQDPNPSALRQRIDGWRDTLSEQIDEHPIRTVAIALGTGYLLAGGLFTRLTARLVGLGIRIGLRVGPRLATPSIHALRARPPRGTVHSARGRTASTAG